MSNKHDVAIIGSGIAGSMLAAILAKKGVNVIVIDAGTHPRFAVGESMVPESGILLNILAQRYDIPELAYPGDIDKITKHIGTSAAGIKLAFSFAWNEEGVEHNPEHMVSTPVIAPEAHLFRQDIDAYYVSVAAKLGAKFIHQRRVSKIAPHANGVTLDLSDDRIIEASFVVDAAGFRSPLADELGLRDGAREMQTNTRSLFTHMVGVELYEEAISVQSEHGSPTHLAQSTLHQMFKGGWLWIIPFNNHPFSTNPLCSVGLQLDISEHGPSTDPEAEFNSFLAKHPSIQKHFKNAQRVREWTVAPRINYTSKSSTGDRYCLLGHAVGFVDPLFSRGLVNTFESINRLAPKIVDSVRSGVWDKSSLSSYEEYSLEVVRVNDRLVANSYTAFDSFALWNAWFRVWISGSYIGVLRLRKVYSDFMQDRDEAKLNRAFEEASFPGHLSIESGAYEILFDDACDAMEAYSRGDISEQETIVCLKDLFLSNKDDLPLDFSDFDNRFLSRSSQQFAEKLLTWANSAPNGLSESLERPMATAAFAFMDEYRYGDREKLNEQADLNLAK